MLQEGKALEESEIDIISLYSKFFNLKLIVFNKDKE